LELITYLLVALPLFFFPASKNLFESDKFKVYFGHSMDNPLFTLEIVVRICPILGGKGLLNISLSSSGCVHSEVNFSINALCSSFYSSVSGA